MDEDLPILLEFRIQDESLELRIDNLGLLNFEISSEAINQIILKSTTLPTNLKQDLEDSVGNVFEFEISEENNKKIFQFYGDYRGIQNKFEFDDYEERFSKYDIEDLIKKGKTLSTLYTDVCEKLQKNSAIHYNLIKKIDFEINNDMEKSRRKSEFYKDTDIAKSQAFTSQEKVLQKYLTILNKSFDY